MRCQCCVLILSKSKLIVKCPDCVNRPKSNNLNHNQIQFPWYQKHILIIRDNPELRTRIELTMLVGYIGMVSLCWLELGKINLVLPNFVNLIIAIIFTGWFGLVVAYLDACQKLKTSPKFF